MDTKLLQNLHNKQKFIMLSYTKNQPSSRSFWFKVSVKRNLTLRKTN